MNASVQFLRRCASVLLMVSAASAARAQGNPITVGIGYQLLNDEELLFPIGLNVDVSTGFAGRFALVGETGWSRNSSEQFGFRDRTTALHLAGGLRWSMVPARRLAPFGQVLIDLERERTNIERFGVDWSSGGVVQPGAGLTVQLASGKDLFAQIDWRHVRLSGSDRNALRFVFGARVGRFK